MLSIKSDKLVKAIGDVHVKHLIFYNPEAKFLIEERNATVLCSKAVVETKINYGNL